MRPTELLDRDELRGLLSETFGVDYQDRMLRYALKAIGIEPKKYQNLKAPQRGRIGLYRRFSAWPIAMVYFKTNGAIRGLENVLGPYRELAPVMKKLPEAAHIPEFNDDSDLAAQLLLAFSSDYGMAVEQLVDFVWAHQGVVEVGWDEVDMTKVLLAVKIARSEWAGTLALPTTEGGLGPEEVETRRRLLVELCVRQVGQALAPTPSNLDQYSEPEGRLDS